MTDLAPAAGGLSIRDRLRRLVMVLGWAALVLAAVAAVQVFSEMQTEREIDEFHAPSAARAEELLYALARLRTPLGANALTVSQV
ncbi:MAG TPA: hypothetical protein VFQ16_06160, partial [Burkholderiaceae bacterium]|nr:hypothetical protein [Burkholderiaceae bacterium]